eukprot:TRINITY_DN9719_c0_g2_i1.p4 TRINITY_DN9719_c0_g2~~TRINITY_DN9719_c0_g2_i1.p4  ORF type:complete len:103 (-),score=6.36 TRINITY_DN9719_c0_g2_i1:190-498(-)
MGYQSLLLLGLPLEYKFSYYYVAQIPEEYQKFGVKGYGIPPLPGLARVFQLVLLGADVGRRGRALLKNEHFVSAYGLGEEQGWASEQLHVLYPSRPIYSTPN